MASLRDGVDAFVEASVCGLFDAGDRLADYLGGALSSVPGFGGAGYDPTLNDGVKNMACSGVPSPVPIGFPESPLTGGQCDAVYKITGFGDFGYDYDRPRGQTQFVDTFLAGPLSNPRVENRDNFVGWYITGGDPNTGVRSEVELTAVTSSLGKVQDGEFGELNVEREDGLPDNCGGPPGGGSPGGNGQIGYDGPDGNPVSVPVGIVFGNPVLTPDGRLLLPWEITGPGLDINGSFDFSTGGNAIGFGPPARPGDGCGPPVVPPEELPPPDEDEPEPEEKSPFRALVVTAVEIGDFIKATEHGQINGPSLFIPRLGTVSIRVKLGDQSAWLPDVSIKHPQQMVPIPEGFVGNAWAVQPISGVVFQVTPVEIERPPEE